MKTYFWVLDRFFIQDDHYSQKFPFQDRQLFPLLELGPDRTEASSRHPVVLLAVSKNIVFAHSNTYKVKDGRRFWTRYDLVPSCFLLETKTITSKLYSYNIQISILMISIDGLPDLLKKDIPPRPIIRLLQDIVMKESIKTIIVMKKMFYIHNTYI